MTLTKLLPCAAFLVGAGALEPFLSPLRVGACLACHLRRFRARFDRRTILASHSIAETCARSLVPSLCAVRSCDKVRKLAEREQGKSNFIAAQLCSTDRMIQNSVDCTSFKNEHKRSKNENPQPSRLPQHLRNPTGRERRESLRGCDHCGEREGVSTAFSKRYELAKGSVQSFLGSK